jgi:hypothetical protein
MSKRKIFKVPDDNKDMRPKHATALILTNKNTVKQIDVKCYVCNMVAWKMYNIKCEGTFVTYHSAPYLTCLIHWLIKLSPSHQI